jgi:hypothetical protein
LCRRTLTSKEPVELHQELEVDIVALGSLAMAVPHMMAIEVDTWNSRRDQLKSSVGGAGKESTVQVLARTECYVLNSSAN